MFFQEKGFTLLETLIVLSILSTLLLLPLITLPNLSSHTLQTSLTAQQIKEDLLLAQHIAMSTGKRTNVHFENQNREYVIRHSVSDHYLVRPYTQEEMYFEVNSSGLFFVSFLPNGHPSRSGSFFIRIGDTRYRYTIYLGKGMVSYKKL